MVKLSRLLYVYLVQYPPMVIFNLLLRLVTFVRPSFMKNPHKGALVDGWMASDKFLKTVQRCLKFQAARETDLNGPAIDVQLYDLKNKAEVSLLSFMQENRPLVVNFGSCT